MKQVSLKILECLERADEENSQFLLEQAAKYENLIDDMQKKYLKRQIKGFARKLQGGGRHPLFRTAHGL